MAPDKIEHSNGEAGVGVQGIDVENHGNHHGHRMHIHVPSSDDTDTKVFDTEAKRHMPVTDPNLFPDGGVRAWSVVAAALLLVFCTFGNSWQFIY
jgi:hypothetical protein